MGGRASETLYCCWCACQLEENEVYVLVFHWHGLCTTSFIPGDATKSGASITSSFRTYNSQCRIFLLFCKDILDGFSQFLSCKYLNNCTKLLAMQIFNKRRINKIFHRRTKLGNLTAFAAKQRQTVFPHLYLFIVYIVYNITCHCKIISLM